MPDTAVQIFADLTNRKLIASATNGAEKLIDKPYPPFQYDKLYFSVQPLTVNPSGGTTNPFTLVDAANYTVTVLIVSSGGTTLSGPVSTWSVDGQAKVGSIDLNTAAMATAMTAQTSITATIEWTFDDGANAKTTIQQSLTIKKAYNSPGVPTEYPLDTYMTRSENLAIFVRYSGNPNGATIELPSPDGLTKAIFGANNDGTVKADAET